MRLSEKVILSRIKKMKDFGVPFPAYPQEVMRFGGMGVKTLKRLKELGLIIQADDPTERAPVYRR